MKRSAALQEPRRAFIAARYSGETAGNMRQGRFEWNVCGSGLGGAAGTAARASSGTGKGNSYPAGKAGAGKTTHL